MNGIINVLKPSGFTSHDVVAKVKRICGVKKVGHTGTLDPNAVGVLPILIGKATKLSDYLMEHDKVYRVIMKLGVSTTTCDAEGEILEQCENIDLDFETVNNAIVSFKGEIVQKPPMYSAIKVNGKKLYELARKGEEVEVPTRKVQIYSISNIVQINNVEYMFDVSCSKGTYIRTLCVDIGEKLGVPAVMNGLIRLQTGDFKISESVTFDEIKENPDSVLIPMDKAIKYPSAAVKEAALKYILNGRSSSVGFLIPIEGIIEDKIKLYDNQNSFLGIAEIFYDDENRKVFKLTNFLGTVKE